MSILTNGQRLTEIWSGQSTATEEEVQLLAEECDRHRRRAGIKMLRDEFAIAALPAVVAAFWPALQSLKEHRPCMLVATSAYEFADAMLEARK